MELFNDLQPITFPGIDPNKPLIIAGPCSAESEEQVLTTAHQLAQNGVKIFRAGIWKPRTKPGGFEGVGLKGLLWMHQVKKETGMYTATEVATHEHVNAALDAGIDLLWIGARTAANPFAMQDIADALRGHEDVPVLVKNPVNPDLELWIGGIQRIYNAGIRKLGAIHRGFSAYGKHIYRNDPQWHIPVELHRRIPDIPIICDPSHMGGKRELISPIAQQSLDMGVDGLMIECHCNPDEAWSDKNQQLTPENLNIILNALVVRDTHMSTENLASLRMHIDECDNELLNILAKRMRVAKEIGTFKKEHNMQIVQAARYDEIMQRRIKQAESLGLNPEFMKEVMQAIHEESVNLQLSLFEDNNQ
ncbi:MAG: bifunctional 3-deoxy-7-phosphoheptulonate synthase/chorismate mutase type II [Bacteroidales bacterium]|nr:bifunctional 3-deoxy-7-phosphoheptulonate synthase/chorismate mutase type II [Candidatus Sodaliphilus fimicaballi]